MKSACMNRANLWLILVLYFTRLQNDKKLDHSAQSYTAIQENTEYCHDTLL